MSLPVPAMIVSPGCTWLPQAMPCPPQVFCMLGRLQLVSSHSFGMGGGHGGPGPPTGMDAVWSPAGGWHPDPKHWRRNTFVVALAMAGVAYLAFRDSAAREVHHQYPTRPIPSQLWCKNFPEKNEKAIGGAN